MSGSRFCSSCGIFLLLIVSITNVAVAASSKSSSSSSKSVIVPSKSFSVPRTTSPKESQVPSYAKQTIPALNPIPPAVYKEYKKPDPGGQLQRDMERMNLFQAGMTPGNRVGNGPSLMGH